MNTLGVTINAESTAASQYAGFNFNSACVFNGIVLMANASGIFTNTGNTDNSVKISSYFELPSSDLELMKQKNLRRLYVTGAFEKFMQVVSIFDLADKTTYTAEGPAAIAEAQLMLNTSHADKGELIGLRIKNVDGSDFSVDKIEATIQILNLKPKQFNALVRMKDNLPTVEVASSAS